MLKKCSAHSLTIHINGSELSLNEKFESFWKVLVRFSFTSCLHSLHELFSVHLIILVEVSNLTDLLPQVDHDILVFLIFNGIPVSLTLRGGVICQWSYCWKCFFYYGRFQKFEILYE